MSNPFGTSDCRELSVHLLKASDVRYTAGLLDLLASLGIKATFFITLDKL